MDTLYLMVTITDRKLEKKFLNFYREQGREVSLTTLGHGTASSEIRDFFGLGGRERSLLFHTVTGKNYERFLPALKRQFRIDLPGSGIVFLIPFSSVGGRKTLEFFTEGQEFVKGEESALKETKYELLVAITNQGYTELVMDAARKVHAAGGTIIHAKGTGTDKAEKFLGVSLVAEKEMVLIVARQEKKNEIMRSIMDHAGLQTKARAVVFSLPVTDIAGMYLMNEMLEEA